MGHTITYRRVWPTLCKTFFHTQYGPLEPWNLEQSSVWLDDVKTFSHYTKRCMLVVLPDTFHQDSGRPSLSVSFDSWTTFCWILHTRLAEGQTCDVEQMAKEDIDHPSDILPPITTDARLCTL